MNVKEYLTQIETLQSKIEQKKIRAKEYIELAKSSGGMDYSKERVQTSNSGGLLEKNVIRYVSLEQEIQDDIIMLEKRKDIITDEIHNLEDARYIKILFKRYVECKNLGKVAKEMKYSYDHIRAIHGEALEMFEKTNFPTKSHNHV